MEKYHRGVSLDAMTDRDRRISCTANNPEEIYIAAEKRAERKARLTAVLKTLTPEQLRLIKMLKADMCVTEITAKLGVSKAAVSQMRLRIQEKNIYNNPLTNVLFFSEL
jgi:FixJ family two-component response regulator